MIQIEGLSKAFGAAKALDQVTMQIKEGSILGLVGSNGAGKSTLLRLMAGVYQADRGTILIGGQTPFENDPVKQQCTYMPDIPRFFRRACLADMARYYRGLYPNWNEEWYTNYVEAFSLDQKKELGRMSKGMQRQAAFVLGLAAMPRYLFLDEAFDGLDPVVCKTCRDLLIHFAAEYGATVVIASHHLRELEDLCDSVCLLHKGKLIFARELDDLKQNCCRVQAVFRHPEDWEALQGQFTAGRVETHGKAVEFTVAQESGAVYDAVMACNPLLCEILPLTLEEIMINTMEGLGYESKILTQ